MLNILIIFTIKYISPYTCYSLHESTHIHIRVETKGAAVTTATSDLCALVDSAQCTSHRHSRDLGLSAKKTALIKGN